jgi:hypothetical protein
MAKGLIKVNIQICSFDFVHINLEQQTLDSEIKNVNELSGLYSISDTGLTY